MTEQRPEVHLLTTGGTISAGWQESGGYSPVMGGAEMVRNLPAGAVANVRAEVFTCSGHSSVRFRRDGGTRPL